MDLAAIRRNLFDNIILAAFREPLVKKDRYANWDAMQEDYCFEHAGEVLSSAMVTCAGPVPERFYTASFNEQCAPV